MRIVILEDMTQVFTVYKFALEGCEVEHALNCAKLEPIQNKQDVDAVIMDYSIPGDNFDDSLVYVKKNFPRARRILISGHTDSMDLRMKYKNELSLILSKPLPDITKLKSMIEDAVAQPVSKQKAV